MARRVVDVVLYNQLDTDLDSMKDEKHLCEDGCGNYAKSGNRFIHGHQNKVNGFNKGKIPWNKGIPRTQEVKDAISKKNKGKKQPPHSDEVKKRISEAHKGKKFSDKHRANIKKSWTPERRKRLGEKKKQEWQEGIFNGKDRRRKVPDFYNKETKEIVELWGTYFHRRQILPEGQRHETEEEVIAWYAEVGWDCRIVWIEEEFDNYYNEILEKVNNRG